jgi:hypothetical protein
MLARLGGRRRLLRHDLRRLAEDVETISRRYAEVFDFEREAEVDRRWLYRLRR